MVYHIHTNESHDSVLTGAKMNTIYYIWVSVCVVMNLTRDNHFK